MTQSAAVSCSRLSHLNTLRKEITF